LREVIDRIDELRFRTNAEKCDLFDVLEFISAYGLLSLFSNIAEKECIACLDNKDILKIY